MLTFLKRLFTGGKIIRSKHPRSTITHAYLIFNEDGELVKRKWYVSMKNAQEALTMMIHRGRIPKGCDIRKFRIVSAKKKCPYYIMCTLLRYRGVSTLNQITPGIWFSQEELSLVIKEHSFTHFPHFRAVGFGLEEV